MVQRIKPLLAGLRSDERFKNAEIERVIPLAGDASARSYNRVVLRGCDVRSVIVMEIGEALPPICSGEKEVSQGESFILFRDFYSQHGINVPEIFIDRVDCGFIIVEDIGDMPLWQFIKKDPKSPEAKAIISCYGDDIGERLLSEAVAIAARLCSIPIRDMPLQRRLGFNEYFAESERFISLYAERRGYSSSDLKVIGKALADLCQRVDQHPKSVCHRDFMAYNIFVLPDLSLALLDFQDTLEASYAYDIGSLLTDRDTDKFLSELQFGHLLTSFAKLTGRDLEELRLHCSECILQRSFRLAGQFLKLSQQKCTEFYRSFVAGCLNRIVQYGSDISYMQDAIGVISNRESI